MHSTPKAPVIRLRRDRFHERARQLKLTSNLACARYIGISSQQLGRILNGDVAPGEQFIAACLNSKFASKFEQLFELGDAS